MFFETLCITRVLLVRIILKGFVLLCIRCNKHVSLQSAVVLDVFLTAFSMDQCYSHISIICLMILLSLFVNANKWEQKQIFIKIVQKPIKSVHPRKLKTRTAFTQIARLIVGDKIMFASLYLLFVTRLRLFYFVFFGINFLYCKKVEKGLKSR